MNMIIIINYNMFLSNPFYENFIVSMTVSGFFIGKFVKMYVVESAIVTCCHSGLEGTGYVAILEWDLCLLLKFLLVLGSYIPNYSRVKRD